MFFIYFFITTYSNAQVAPISLMKKGINLPTVNVNYLEILSLSSNAYVFSSTYFINDSKSPITEKGFVFSTSDTSKNFTNKTILTVANNVNERVFGYYFESSATLSPFLATTYYLRAYVKNSNNQYCFSGLTSFNTVVKDPGFLEN